jgi:hypothetical protein
MDGSPGQGLGGEGGVSEETKSGVFTVDKRKGLEQGAGSSRQLLWLKVLGHLGLVLFRAGRTQRG